MASDSCFSCVNKFMLWFGIAYLIYQVCYVIFDNSQPLFINILTFLFIAILILASAFSRSMQRSSSLKCYILAVLFLFVYVLVLVLVALLKHYISNILSIIMFICWCVLGLCLFCALIIAINMKKENAGYNRL